MNVRIPGGQDKGKLPSEASDRSLQYWAEKGNGADVREACQAELQRRAGGAPPAARPAQPRPAPLATTQQQPQVIRRPSEPLIGSYGQATHIDSALRQASQDMHLVAPATSCGSIPEGTEVAISLVYVSADTSKGGPGDVAPMGGGKLSLSGAVLKKIAAAAGVDWDPVQSRRLDNGRHPHYCHFRAVGRVRLFDGTWRTVTGEVEIDMRDGSPQIEAMRQRAKEGANIDSQIRDTRLFLLRHAETKAKLRAIADMGVKRSYTESELSKPFAVARLMWTGRTSDPELRRVFAEKQFDAFHRSAHDLYGEPVRSASAALPAAHRAPAAALPSGGEGHDPPLVGDVPADDAAFDTYGESIGSGPYAGADDLPPESAGAGAEGGY